MYSPVIIKVDGLASRRPVSGTVSGTSYIIAKRGILRWYYRLHEDEWTLKISDAAAYPDIHNAVKRLNLIKEYYAWPARKLRIKKRFRNSIFGSFFVPGQKLSKQDLAQEILRHE